MHKYFKALFYLLTLSLSFISVSVYAGLAQVQSDVKGAGAVVRVTTESGNQVDLYQNSYALIIYRT